MDRQELHDLLVAKNVDPNSFDVFGSDLHPLPGDIYVLRKIRSGLVGKPAYWATYYSERGKEVGPKHFVTEDEACRSFLTTMKSDATIAR